MPLQQTYTETVHRWVVEAMYINLPEAHRAEQRLNGIDPDDNWQLIWSFTNEEAARQQMEEDQHGWQGLRTYRVRDLGAPRQIVRPIY